MNTESNSNDEQYPVTGSVPLDSFHYVSRRADEELGKNLKAGKFCYVLNPRQTGKSSLMIQINHYLERQIDLEQTHYTCAILYVSELITKAETVTEEKWYEELIYWLAENFIAPIHQDSRLEFEEWFTTWINDHNNLSPVDCLKEFVEKVLIVKIKTRIIIFLDEIDSLLRLDFPSDKFWKFIESCYKNRQNVPDYERLTFAVFGVATLDELIQDRDNKLFEIGQPIELDGFGLHSIKPLEGGLKNKFGNNNKTQTEESVRVRAIAIKSAMTEIIKWTNGHPFLTNKICQLLQDSSEPLPTSPDKIQQFVKELIKSKIIDNWQDKKDEASNLKAIYDQILARGRRNPRLFECYQEIIEKGEIDANDSREQRELLISGLAIKKDGKLKIYNKIYQEVFNKEWLKKVKESIPPFSESFHQWLNSNQDRSYLLHGQQLIEAYTWILHHKKELTENVENFLSESGDLDKIKSQQAEAEKQLNETKTKNLEKELSDEKNKVSATTEQLLAQEELKAKDDHLRVKDNEIAELKNQMSSQNDELSQLKTEQKKLATQISNFRKKTIIELLRCFLLTSLLTSLLSFYFHDNLSKTIARIPLPKPETKSDQEGFSSEEDPMTKGIENFNSGNNEQAVSYFEQALKTDSNNPRKQIYLNNAKARLNGGSSFTIAIVLSNSEEAQEILRGVADAQMGFNDKTTLDNNFHSEIIIFDYKNRAKLADKISEGKIRGMIITDSSCQNIKEYKQSTDKDNQSRLPIISMESTQISLCPRNLTKKDQMTFSDSQLAKKLTEYADKKLEEKKKKKKVVIFYDSQTNANLEETFKEEFERKEWEIYKSVDLRNHVDPDSEIDRILKAYVSAAVLLPSQNTYDAALKIIQVNAKNTSTNGGLQLFSNHIMYNSKTLIEGQSSVEGLTLILPWSDETPSGKKSYVEQANKTWYGQTSWRTAASYAATKALIEAYSLSNNAEGTTPLVKLEDMKPSGDPPLVIVSPDAPTPKNAELGFMPLPEEKK